MGWLKETVAPLQFQQLTAGANSKTRIRKEQRQHSKLSYQAMKTKLLCLVRPLPLAIQASDLETFRADLFQSIIITMTQDFSEQPESQPTEAIEQTTDMPQAVTCNWCGTWVPLSLIPLAHNELETTGAGVFPQCAADITGELGNQPTVTQVAVAAFSDPDKNKATSATLGELGNQPIVTT